MNSMTEANGAKKNINIKQKKEISKNLVLFNLGSITKSKLFIDKYDIDITIGKIRLNAYSLLIYKIFGIEENIK